jgi:sulfide:quinone oxidoreductase
MFAVPKYSQALERLRVERGVEGLFQHDLARVDAGRRVATFRNLADGGRLVEREYDLLHVVPPQRPWEFVAQSPLGE